MKSALHRAIAGGLLLAAAAVAAEPPPLGRLFTTPERRAALDRQRSLNIKETQQAEDPTVSVNGLVRRSSGKNTAWINGVPQPVEQSGAVWSAAERGRSGEVTLTLPGDAPSRLNVGDTLYRGSGEVATPLQGGRISITPGPRGAAGKP